MAITKILRRTVRMDQLIRYVTNPLKTQSQILTAYLNGVPQTAFKQMQQTAQLYGKDQGTQAFHIIQSFAPGEITPELALQLAQEFAQEHLKEYQVVIGTHCDHAHIHNHIVCAPIRGRVNPLSKRLA